MFPVFGFELVGATKYMLITPIHNDEFTRQKIMVNRIKVALVFRLVGLSFFEHGQAVERV